MTTAEILAKIRNLSALVVGDICLDRWCMYDPSLAEPSRETNIPRIGVVSGVVTPGAGGTVANNLAALGTGKVAVLGVIGDDGHGHELKQALKARGIGSDHLIEAPGVQTFTYTKLMDVRNGVEDLPRVDFVNASPLVPEVERQVLDRLQLVIENFDVVVVSDQAETHQGGVVTPAVRDLIAELAPAYPEKIFFVDSRMRIEHFRRVIVKPNHDEAQAACMRAFGEIYSPRLLRHVEGNLLIVTHGGDGVLLVTPSGESWVRTKKVEKPVDICGAGDSFTSGAALALAAEASPAVAARFGNQVASITIMKKGTGTASPAELLAHEDARD
jgi:rfaE bifunctional protein kinase chain/domain